VSTTSPAALAAAQFQLGLDAGRSGQLATAEAHFRAAAEILPSYAQAHNNLGVALERQGKFREATVAYQAAIRLRPDYVEAWHHLGISQERLGDYRSSADSCRRAIALQPNYIDAYNGLGVALHYLGEWDEAAACLRHLLSVRPDYAEGHSNLANVLEALGDFTGAVRHLQQAIALNPGGAGPYVNLGLLLERESRTAEAEQMLKQAIAIEPACRTAHNNLSLLFDRQSRDAEAEWTWARALELEPDCAEAHLGLGLSRLRRGDFAGGAKEYEWRFRIPGIPNPKFTQPRWDGSPLAGRTILFWEDQGCGDSIHFVRYAPLVAARGGRVVVCCRPQLMTLLATCAGVEQVVSNAEPLPPFDVYIPMPDLPGAVGTTLETIPGAVPYLSADETTAARWREEWQGIRELKVGIVWQGDPTNTADAQRSIPLEHFHALAQVEGVRLFSLQFGAGREQLAKTPAGVAIADLGDRLGDFYQTAGAVKNLDLVITCDSAPGHLAGSLGVPVWVALAELADWRWLRERSDTPWYPSMRLFRQRKYGDWAEVFARIRDELASLAAAHRLGG
jgi:tetratricopeptide (TPR) repeat protein